MSAYSTRLLLTLSNLTSVEEETRDLVGQVLQEARESLEEIATKFRLQEVTPATTYQFETELAEAVREMARRLTGQVYNSLEPKEAEQMPHHVHYEGGGYRRRNDQTRNGHVATLFGTIELWRYAYRDWHGSDGCIFPLELQLGLVQGATPALAEVAARYLGEAGASQAAVLERLKQQHNVSWGAERLRSVAQEVAEAMAAVREDVQVERLLELLKKADESRGNRLPVLSVGRDGITLREYRHRFFENATVATITVYDRRGNRLGTVYLAYAPELDQPTMTSNLTALITRVLESWEGTLPRLVYVTDAGDSESKYYRRVLRTMHHPRTGHRLHWYRIVDYYHTSQRIWTMAECLFGRQKDGKLKKAARAWARRMCRLLKKPNGPYRVLHAAAAMRARRRLSKKREKDYRRAYNYIRHRTKFMQYATYKDLHLPIGSGITEAACKTIFTQRLKLSGMRWTKKGAQTILDLRVILLSGVWPKGYAQYLGASHRPPLRVYEPQAHVELYNAA
jgi:hypothetical protein